MNGVANRIASLLPEESDVISAPRSPAQRRASRRNGSKSRGPISRDGKFRSSQNAQKHGFLSARFTPPADGRGDDISFRKIRRELAAEFKPTTFFGGVTLDYLAHDMIQLARCRAMIEAAQRPAAIPVEDLEKYRQLCDARRDQKSAQRLLGRLESGLQPDCSPKAAKRIAACIANAIEGLREYVQAPDGLTVDQMDDTERAEFIPLRDRWLVLWRGRKRLLDHAHTASVVQGHTRLGVAERDRLRVALTQVIVDLDRVIAGQQKLEAQMRRQQDESLLAMAKDPNGLLLLRRYCTRIERGIERKLKELRRE